MKNFDDIRPFRDDEVHAIMQELIAEPQFISVLKAIFPHKKMEDLKAFLLAFHSQWDFQRDFIARSVRELTSQVVTSNTLEGWDQILPGIGQVFISNHRDIILDAAFFNILRIEHGIQTTEIAIGDNLFVYPWIEKLVRLNKSFIVRRGASIRQQLEVSRRLSEYIHHTTKTLGHDIWIAQREGRAKDSNDLTQDALLKMLAMGSKLDIRSALLELNITPLTFSYEYDPCDYLKAWEFQSKRDNPDHKKSSQDDYINMSVGLAGYKGEVHLHLSSCINEQIEQLPESMEKGEFVSNVSAIIDRSIHSNYRIYANNYIALDLLNKTTTESEHYTAGEKQRFEQYLEGQLAKIKIENPDHEFLRERILTMYANPLINYRKSRA